ncbi:hypothetical protein WA158_003071 [Blastocystis sp. Blastoise]
MNSIPVNSKLRDTTSYYSHIDQSASGGKPNGTVKDYWAAPLAQSNENTSVTPQFILDNFPYVLTAFEKLEIQNYTTIYFTGRRGHKIDGKVMTDYDTPDGLYTFSPGDQIAYRYEIVSKLGNGTFSQVMKCYDYKSRRYIAIKIIRRGDVFFQQGWNEVKIMKLIYKADPDNTHCLNHVINSFIFREHLCIVTPLLGKNLFNVLEERDFQGLDMPTIQFICKQVLISLCLLKSLNVVHCDLKPENILLLPHQSDLCYVKTVDLGSCLRAGTNSIQVYIQSRYYRAPEVILGIPFSFPIDMWSLGCILFELYVGYPIFSGENEKDQIILYINTLGLPPRDILNKSTRRNEFFSGCTPFMTLKNGTTLDIPPENYLKQRIPIAPVEFQDFLFQCLQWRPKDRITCEDALNHPFLVNKFETMSPQYR